MPPFGVPSQEGESVNAQIWFLNFTSFSYSRHSWGQERPWFPMAFPKVQPVCLMCICFVLFPLATMAGRVPGGETSLRLKAQKWGTTLDVLCKCQNIYTFSQVWRYCWRQQDRKFKSGIWWEISMSLVLFLFFVRQTHTVFERELPGARNLALWSDYYGQRGEYGLHSAVSELTRCNGRWYHQRQDGR